MNPSDRLLRSLGYLLCAVATGFLGATIWRDVSDGDIGSAIDRSLLLTFPLVLMVLVRAVPRHTIIWLLIGFGVIGSSLDAMDLFIEARHGLVIEELGTSSLSPSSLSVIDALVVDVGSWVWIWVTTFQVLLLLLFPSGRTSSRPAKWLVGTSVLAAAVVSVSVAPRLAPWVDTPYRDLVPTGWPQEVTAAFYLHLALMVAALIELIRRYRRSTGVERLQFRWVALALGGFVSTIVLAFPLYFVGIEIPGWVSTAALVAIPVSIGIAITKYRLYDIDLVISRSLLFVALVGFITLVYAAVVAGIGSVVGGTNLGWSIAATAVVAVVFEPVRHRLQRWINRLVYGQRATPYEVLADLTGRLARTEREEGILDRMAQRVAEGTGADRVVVWNAADDGYELVACEPPEGRQLVEAMAPDEPGGVAVPIEHHGETLGAITVESRRGESLSVTERRLVDDLCGSAGLIMRRRRLDDQLEEKAEQLEESRRRLVSAQDDERRRLEQQLNHGPRQQIVALRTQLATAEQLARSGGVDRIADFLAQMVTETQDAIDQIHALALGIYPPLLEAEGLPAAINALADSAPVDVRLDIAETARHRLPLPLEAAAYFCISEALTNAVKHGAPPITIQLAGDDDELAFTVTDTGPGFDPATVTRGSGLNNLNDRVDALGGTIIIDSTPGRSTVVIGELPLDLATSAR